MKKLYLFVAALVLSVSFSMTSLAATTQTTTQKPAPKPAPTTFVTEEVSKTESIAIRTLVQDINTVESEVTSFQEEVAKNHPGYRYNFQAGKLEHIPEPAPAVAPAPKK